MTTKALKSFSIASFCIPFVSVLCLFSGFLFISNDFLSLFFLILYMVSSIPGLTLAILELVFGSKNKKNGEKGGIKGLSIAAIVLNGINLLITLFILAILIISAFESIQYKKNHRIPLVEEQYQGIYLQEEFYSAFKNSSSYLEFFNKNDEDVTLYAVEPRMIKLLDSNGEKDMIKADAIKFQFFQQGEETILTDHDEKKYYKISQDYSLRQDYFSHSDTEEDFGCSCHKDYCYEEE